MYNSKIPQNVAPIQKLGCPAKSVTFDRKGSVHHEDLDHVIVAIDLSRVVLAPEFCRMIVSIVWYSSVSQSWVSS